MKAEVLITIQYSYTANSSVYGNPETQMAFKESIRDADTPEELFAELAKLDKDAYSLTRSIQMLPDTEDTEEE